MEKDEDYIKTVVKLGERARTPCSGTAWPVVQLNECPHAVRRHGLAGGPAERVCQQALGTPVLQRACSRRGAAAGRLSQG